MEEDHARRGLNPRIFEDRSTFARRTLVHSKWEKKRVSSLKTSYLSKKNKRFERAQALIFASIKDKS